MNECRWTLSNVLTIVLTSYGINHQRHASAAKESVLDRLFQRRRKRRKGSAAQTSTKTTDRKLAQKLADEWEQLEKLAGERTADREPLPESYRSDVRAHSRRTAALPHRSRVSERMGGEQEKRNGTAHLWKYGRSSDEFLAHVGVKADRLLREITPTDIRSWRDALKRRGSQRQQ